MSKKTSEQAARELVDSFNREVRSGGSGQKTKELAREIGGEETRETERRAKSRRSRTKVRQPVPKAEPESVPQTEDVSKTQSTAPKEDVTVSKPQRVSGDREIISGVIAQDTERTRLQRIRDERARQEAKNTFRGDVASGFGAAKEVVGETALAVGGLARGATRITGFERKGGVIGFFPSPVPKTTPINIPTLKDIEDAGASLGAEFKRDPIKGGVLIVAEIASGPVPIAGLRGQRLVSSSARNVPSPLTSNIPSTGQPFKVADSVGTTLVQLDKKTGSGSVTTVGGQLDLTGDLARSPSSAFRRGDFVPVQTTPGGKLDFLPPNDPRLRSEAFSPLRSPSQSTLVDPKASSVGDPVLVTDKFSGRTVTVEASALPDFLAESPGRFTDVRRPSPTGLTMDQRFKTLDSRQTQLNPDSPSQPFFASLFPVPPIERFSGGSGFSSVKSTFMDVSDVGKGSIGGSTKPPGFDKGVSTPFIGASGVSSLGTQNVADLKPINLTSSVATQDLKSDSRTKAGVIPITDTTTSLITTPEVASGTRTASKSRSAMRTTPALVTQPKTGLGSLTRTTPATTTTTTSFTRPVRRTSFRPTGFPGLDITRQRRTTLKTSFSFSRSPSLRSIRTAGAGRDFIISPGRRRAGRVVELRKGVKGKTGKRKKKEERSFSSSTRLSFGGLNL